MVIKKLIGIAACDPKGVIGKEGCLPWHSPEDLKHFSTMIAHHPIVMGYQTYLSLPSHYFKERFSLIFTRKKLSSPKPNQFFISSLVDFFVHSGKIDEKTFYVIGGAQIYELFLKENLLSGVILTEFKETYEGDRFFPLTRLVNWPRREMEETIDFRIYDYQNPSKPIWRSKWK